VWGEREWGAGREKKRTESEQHPAAGAVLVGAAPTRRVLVATPSYPQKT
jgi:hypothetical protein